MRYFAPLFAFLLLGAATVPGPASAQPFGPRQGVQSGQVRSLGEILDNVRRQRPGNLADVQGPNIGPSGEPHYRLKWVSPNGRVEWLDTDARTGRVLGVEGPDPGPNIFPGGPGPRGLGPRGRNVNPSVDNLPRGAGPVIRRRPGPGFGGGPRPGFPQGGNGPRGGPRRFRDGR